MRLRLALLVPATLCAALHASAAELTFQRFVAPGGSVEATRTALSPDGRHLYATFEQLGGIAVYERDFVTGSLAFVEEHASGGALGVIGTPTEAIATPDGRFVIFATSGGLLVARRDPADGTLALVELEGTGFDVPHTYTPSVAQSSDGEHVYAGTSAGRVIVFSRSATTGALTHVETEEDAASVARHFGFVRDLGISPDGEFVYVACDTEDAIVSFARNPIDGELGWIGDAAPTTDPIDLEFSPDGTRLFAGGLQSDGTARVVVFARDVASGALDDIGSTAWAFDSEFPATAIEPDGSHVFATSTSAIVSVDADDGEGSFDTEFPLLEDGVAGVGLPGDLAGISVSPDGRHAYATGSEGPIAVFAVATYDFVEAQVDAGFLLGLVSVSSLALSPDATSLYATGAGEDAIQIFGRDAQTGTLYSAGAVRESDLGVSGLDGVRDVVVSPRGDFVYAVSANSDAAVTFARNPSGLLTFVGAVLDGQAGARLDGAFALAISPDGKNVYVASDAENALSAFGVAPETGALTPAGSFADGVAGVDGLAAAQSVVVSPDGKHVYAGGRGDDAIAIFSRDPFLGTLLFQSAVTNAGLDGVTDVAISPDGSFLYATGFDADALVRFTRNPTTGALTNPSVTSHAAGVVDGLDGPRSVEISRSGKRLFVTGDVGSVLAVYRRDPDNGVLKLIQAEEDQKRTANALGGVRATAVSRDGRHLYAAAPIDDAVVAFAPEPEATLLALVAAIAIGSIRRMGARP